jgi:mannose-6-phosphate isomerase-like protein (cupin superfamily)
MSLPAPARTPLRYDPASARGVRTMHVLRWEQRLDGPFSETAVRQKLEALGYQPRPGSNPSGTIVSARVHQRERAAAVLAGLLKVTMENQAVILTAGDIVFVPAGVPRRIEAVGTSAVVCVEAVNRFLD